MTQDTNEETPILSEYLENDPDEYSTKQNRKHDIGMEVLKCEILRLNKIIKLSNVSMDDISSDSSVQLGLKRLPALFLTLAIELIGGLIIMNYL